MISGLEDVVAAETVLSDVDGQGGRLTLRGHALAEVAGRLDYARLAAMLFDGFFDDLPRDIAPGLGGARRGWMCSIGWRRCSAHWRASTFMTGCGPGSPSCPMAIRWTMRCG